MKKHQSTKTTPSLSVHCQEKTPCEGLKKTQCSCMKNPPSAAWKKTQKEKTKGDPAPLPSDPVWTKSEKIFQSNPVRKDWQVEPLSYQDMNRIGQCLSSIIDCLNDLFANSQGSSTVLKGNKIFTDSVQFLSSLCSEKLQVKSDDQQKAQACQMVNVQSQSDTSGAFCQQWQEHALFLNIADGEYAVNDDQGKVQTKNGLLAGLSYSGEEKNQILLCQDSDQLIVGDVKKPTLVQGSDIHINGTINLNGPLNGQYKIPIAKLDNNGSSLVNKTITVQTSDFSSATLTFSNGLLTDCS